jgi:hypothetical protein
MVAGGRRERGALLLVALAALAVLAACGSSSGDRARRPDAKGEQQHWAHAVDTVCSQTEQRVAARGRPASLAALPAAIAGAADDVRDGARAVRAVRTPAGMEEKVAGFHRAAARLDPMLAALERAVAAEDAPALEQAVAVLEGDLEVLRSSASGLGLEICSRGRGAHVAFEALDALFFVREVTVLDRRMQGKVKRLTRATPTSVADAVSTYRRLGALAGEWIRGWDGLSMPDSARRESHAYRRVLRAEQRLCATVADELAGQPAISPASAASIQARFTALGHRERRAFRTVLRAISSAAEPVTPDPPGETTPDEPEQT